MAESRNAIKEGETRKTKLTIAMQPPARPSNPSLRFTALEKPVMVRIESATNRPRLSFITADLMNGR